MHLLADIGGTNARLVLARAGERPGRPTRVDVAAYPSAELAFAAMLDGVHPEGIAVAAAGPVTGETVVLTNAHWRLEAAALARTFGVRVRLYNDLEAVALSLAHLGGDDLGLLRPGLAQEGAPRLVLNLGTGFGGALAVASSSGWTAVAAEPGHMRFAPTSEAEARLAAHAPTIEDVLSGRGLALAHAVIAGRAVPLAPAEVMAGAGQGGAADAALDLAIGVLARTASDLVLAMGAWGGLYLCGGVLERLAETAQLRLVRALEAAFSRPNPVAVRLARVPVQRITHPHPALLGLAAGLGSGRTP
ncbi:MAG: ROK family protein [Pseudomonadota bacterium]